MQLTNTEQRWGLVARLLHWATFLVILGAWYAVEMHSDFPKGSDERAQWMMLHKALGLSVFFLVWLRLGARIGQTTPAATGTALQQKLAKGIHLGLYALMIGMPLGGLLAMQLFGAPVSWFGLFEIPVFLAENKELGKNIIELHEAAWSVLFVLVIAHMGAAGYHQFVKKDGTLRRML